MNEVNIALNVINELNWVIPEEYVESCLDFHLSTNVDVIIIKFGNIEVYNSELDTLSLIEDKDEDCPNDQIMPRMKKIILFNLEQSLNIYSDVFQSVKNAKEEDSNE